MNTEELLRSVLSDDVVRRTFGGVLPRDKLPKKILKDFPVSFIVNTDTGRGPGKHWVAFYLENRHYGEFFDSYGYRPEHLAKEFGTFLSKNVENWEHNRRKLQGDFSTVCGQYCLFFLHRRCRGYDVREIAEMFRKDTDANDLMVNRFVNDAYDHNLEVLDTDYLVDQIALPFMESLKRLT